MRLTILALIFAGGLSALDVRLFVAHDCPVSNAYAPEIARMCREYASRGVRCELVYLPAGEAIVNKHQEQFGWGGIASTIDRGHAIARRTGATVTPEAALVRDGKVLYLGRIDDRYLAWGKSRRQARVHDLRLAIEQALAGKPVTTPRTKAVGCYIPFDR